MIELCDNPFECSYNPKAKGVMFSKKGMATKAFVKNLAEGNLKKLQQQIKKGTVKYVPFS